MAPIPIIVTGGGESIGRTVVDLMQPEYEVIHFSLRSSIEEELPSLLTGKPPASPSSELGSGNWASRPRALLLGGAFTDADVDRLSGVMEGTQGAARIPWLRTDSAKGKPPSLTPTPEEAKMYGEMVVGRMKAALEELKGEGKLEEGNGQVIMV